MQVSQFGERREPEYTRTGSGLSVWDSRIDIDDLPRGMCQWCGETEFPCKCIREIHRRMESQEAAKEVGR